MTDTFSNIWYNHIQGDNMRAIKDKVGNKYGHLIVKEFYKRENKRTYWLCQCACGNTKIVLGNHLTNGNTISCGCLKISPNGFSPRRIDEVGNKYGRLTVIMSVNSFGRGSKKRSKFLCKCDCGNEVIVQGANLRSGHTKACGEHINELEYGESAFRRVVARIRGQAIRRGYSWELDYDFVKHITSSSCFYCGESPKQISFGGKRGDYIYNGIDRIDNSKGYTPKNVVPCCGICNRAKDVMSLERFKSLITNIYTNWASR